MVIVMAMQKVITLPVLDGLKLKICSLCGSV